MTRGTMTYRGCTGIPTEGWWVSTARGLIFVQKKRLQVTLGPGLDKVVAVAGLSSDPDVKFKVLLLLHFLFKSHI